jgi:asparagine synthase (glutamine-hydrolysing)
MFKYIALAWDPAAAASAVLGQSLVVSLRAARWQQEMRHPQFTVFSSGTVAGVNEAHRLRDGRGLVLGRLFHRRHRQAVRQHLSEPNASSDETIAADDQALLDDCWGRYVAFLASPNGEARVLRDPSGTLPCFVLRHGGVTVVFSWLEDVLDLLPQIPAPEVDREAVAAYMGFGELTGRRTALRGVTQVLAGECLSLTGIGSDAVDLLWSASRIADSPAALEPEEAVTVLRDTVTDCVQAWARCYDSILLRLSGGVDSTILAACLGKGQTPARVTCLNYHSVGSDSDERAFARLAATAAGLELIEYERDASFRLERVLDVARTPSPHPYVGRLPSSIDAEIASVVGAPVMFTGAGGDQLFYEVPRWWPAADFLRLRGFGAGFLGAALDAARLGQVSVWSAMRLAVADRFRTMPPPQDLHQQRTLISNEVWNQVTRPAGCVHPVFLSKTTLPIGKLMQVQQLAHTASYYDPFGRERAPEPVHPLLSQPLMELCLKLPTFVLARGGRGRGLARDAFKGRIPDAIANRRAKGGLGEHLETVLNRNRDFARQVLLDGELVRLGLLDRAGIEKAFSAQAAGMQTPAGEIHLAIGVEAWLRRSSAPRGRAA